MALTDYDKKNLSADDQLKIEAATTKWNEANAKGDTAGMAAAAAEAAAIRNNAGYKTDDSGNFTGAYSPTTGLTNTSSTATTNKVYTPNGSYKIGSQKGQDIARDMGINNTYTASDGSIWTKNTDGTITVVHNGVTTNNAYKPSDLSILLQQQMEAGVPYQDVERTLAERINKALGTEGLEKYAYDDIYNAAQAYILDGKKAANKENSMADINAYMDDYYANNARPSSPQSDPRIDEYLNKILNREDFSYNAENDPLYQQYKAMYLREGDRAMRDTLAEVASGAGGMNSYAVTAAQQAANYYNSQLGDKIPELYQLAYQMYLQDKESIVQDLGLLQDMDATQYARYRDTMSDWKDDRNFAYGLYQDAVNQGNYQTEFDYNAMLDNRNFNYDNYWNNKEFDANQEQLGIQNNQWQQQFDETVKQNEIGNNQWQQQFNANQEQLGIENERYDTEFELENGRYDQQSAQEEVLSIISAGDTPPAELVERSGWTQATINALVADEKARRASLQASGASSKQGTVYEKEAVDEDTSEESENKVLNFNYKWGDSWYDAPISNKLDLRIGAISDEEVLRLVEEGKVILSADNRVRWAGKWNEDNYTQKYPY